MCFGQCYGWQACFGNLALKAFSSTFPIEIHKSANRDRSLKENARSRLWNRILTISGLNQNASGLFQYYLSQSPLWLVASKYSAFWTISHQDFTLRIQLPSQSLPCSSKPTQTFQLQALVLISRIRTQTFSALNVRSHQRRKFSSSTLAYRNDKDLKLTGARNYFFQKCVSVLVGLNSKSLTRVANKDLTTTVHYIYTSKCYIITYTWYFL